MSKDEKTIVIVNRGMRPFRVSTGLLEPGGSTSLPEAEGRALLEYKELADAAKVAPQQAAKVSKLEQENADLREQLAAEKAKGKAPKVTVKVKQQEEGSGEEAGEDKPKE